MSSIAEEVKKFARAIATANGHPDPDAWAEDVLNAYAPPSDPAPVVENAPVEITLQPEIPAV